MSSLSLHQACASGKIKVVKNILKRKVNVNLMKIFYRQSDPFTLERVLGTPLIAAIKNNQIHIIKLLLSHGSSANVRGEDGLSSLHYACSQGSLKVIRILIKHGAKVNVACKLKITPLHLAVLRKNTDVVKLLLRSGAEPNVKDVDGRSPLHIATDKGYYDIAEILLKCNANVKSKNKYGVTPLHLCRNEKMLQIYLLYYNVESPSSLSQIVSRSLEKEIPKYCDEIIKMKEVRLNVNTTLYDLTLKGPKSWSEFINNSTLREICSQNGNFCSAFPLYGNRLNKQYKMCISQESIVSQSNYLLFKF